jgi:hypothetical protein
MREAYETPGIKHVEERIDTILAYSPDLNRAASELLRVKELIFVLLIW